MKPAKPLRPSKASARTVPELTRVSPHSNLLKKWRPPIFECPPKMLALSLWHPAVPLTPNWGARRNGKFQCFVERN